ncbi:unnamed protein product [Dibothriocephalus latus]|uniref:Uncharacterized protein n=1 Tax=Dibothriocephalus latus TaxID=60516 RepID=A0A3P7M090_DIBLA|nr:unnamed protein product [Dibothriocephalus latus]
MDIQTKEDDQLSPTKRDGSIEPPFESSSPPSDNNDEGIHEPEDFRELSLPVPFSALTQTMRPNIRPHRHTSQSSSSSTEDAEQNSLLEESANGKVGHDQAFRNVSRPSCITDEFGFKVDLTRSFGKPQILLRNIF